MSAFRYDDLRVFAEKRFQQLFTAAYPGVPIRFGNAPFKQPNDGVWARFIVKTAKAFPVSMGKVFWERTPGFLEIQAFAPESNGDADTKKMIEAGIGFFEYGNWQTESGLLRCCEVRPPDDLGINNSLVRYAGRVFFEYDVKRSRPN